MKPVVFVAILVKQKGRLLQYWLDSLSQWDYPKDRMIIYIRENNSTDDSEKILKFWVAQHGHEYLDVIEDYRDLDIPLEKWGVHEWNTTRFRALGEIREFSIYEAMRCGADFYFVCDVDNFLLPFTLSRLVEHNLPIVAPFLRYAQWEGEETHDPYSNYHHLVNENGYYLDNFAYYRVLNQEIKGLIDCQVVHCTYLIRKDVLPFMKYVEEDPESKNYEYVTFSNNCRDLKIPQYLDNQLVYGYLTLTENLEAVKKWMKILADAKATKELTWQQNLLS